MQDFKLWRIYERLENTTIKHLSSESRKSECMMLAKALYSFSYAMCVCKWKNTNKQSKMETKENKKRDMFFPSCFNIIYEESLPFTVDFIHWTLEEYFASYCPICLLLFVNFFVDKGILCYLHFESWNNIFKQEWHIYCEITEIQNANT